MGPEPGRNWELVIDSEKATEDVIGGQERWRA